MILECFIVASLLCAFTLWANKYVGSAPTKDVEQVQAKSWTLIRMSQFLERCLGVVCEVDTVLLPDAPPPQSDPPRLATINRARTDQSITLDLDSASLYQIVVRKVLG